MCFLLRYSKTTTTKTKTNRCAATNLEEVIATPTTNRPKSTESRRTGSYYRYKYISAIVMMWPHPASLCKANQISSLSMSDTLPSWDATGLMLVDSSSFWHLISIFEERGKLVALFFSSVPCRGTTGAKCIFLRYRSSPIICVCQVKKSLCGWTVAWGRKKKVPISISVKVFSHLLTPWLSHAKSKLKIYIFIYILHTIIFFPVLRNPYHRDAFGSNWEIWQCEKEVLLFITKKPWCWQCGNSKRVNWQELTL